MKSFASLVVVVVAVFGCRGRVPVVEGEGEVVGEGEGEVVEGEGDVVGGEGEGEVVCVGLEVRCGDRCVDVQSDDDNCGVCGDVCADDERCTGGRCNARCVNPRLDVGGDFVGNFPELVDCFAARYDVDGDGAIDDVCGGFRVVTEPEFAVEATGVDAAFGGADLSPTPGLELVSGCRVIDDVGGQLSFDEPCDLAGNGIADVDDDGDFDLVLKDGRVFEHTVDGLVPGAPLPPLPGPVTRFRFDDGEALVSWSRERSALVRLIDGVWVDAGALDVELPILQLMVSDDSDSNAQTLIAWQGSIIPNLTLCAWRAGFDCRMASSSASIIASPPRDGRFSRREMGIVVAADGTEVGFGGPVFTVPNTSRAEQNLVAMSRDHAWFVSATGAVSRQVMVPVIAMPVSARVHQRSTVVDVHVEPDVVVVGGDVFPLPVAGAVTAMLAHPHLPVLWLEVTAFPQETSDVVALDVESGVVLSVTERRDWFFSALAAPLQIVDVDDDGALELLSGFETTVVFDAATGALLEERDGFVRYVDVGGEVAVTSDVAAVPLDIDVDGDGVPDELSPRFARQSTRITTASGVIDVGRTNVVFAGPGRRQVSIFDEFSGAVTWDLLCD